jgi:acetyl-CoA acetyltransferase
MKSVWAAINCHHFCIRTPNCNRQPVKSVTGSTALYLACQAVASGSTEVALALGFEQMNPGKLDLVFGDRKRTMDRLTARLGELLGEDTSGPLNAAMYFGAAGLEHQRHYGTAAETFARVAVKARQHASKNPLALFVRRCPSKRSWSRSLCMAC